MWFCTEVLTENRSFVSEIPPVRWKRDGEKWNSEFLGNANSREGLFGDNPPVGYSIGVVLVRDNTDNLKYGTINNAKRIEYDELDYVFFKFNTLEQGGYSQNL
jgi:hypothetical protein